MPGPLDIIADMRRGSVDSDHTISNAVGCNGSLSSCSACRRNIVSSIVKALSRNGMRTTVARSRAGAEQRSAFRIGPPRPWSAGPAPERPRPARRVARRGCRRTLLTLLRAARWRSPPLPGRLGRRGVHKTRRGQVGLANVDGRDPGQRGRTVRRVFELSRGHRIRCVPGPSTTKPRSARPPATSS
jgi:hypothetical protein